MENKKDLILARKSSVVAGDKYEILVDEDAINATERPKDVNGSKLYRIRALKDFANVKKGDLGGYIANFRVLSQEGNCWIDRNCMAFRHVRISGDAQIIGNVELRGNTTVSGKSIVDGRVVAGDCNFEFESKIKGHLILLQCSTRGKSSITGDGCAEHLVLEFGKSVELNGYYPHGAKTSD